MADPRRVPPVDSPEAATRDSQVETLLVEGLDFYFNGRYEDAIHLWTRVLFLDRSHARARAYIERARSALAERQRRGEEMLEASQDLLDRGQTDAARHLLREVVADGGDDERASALRLKLERVERAHAASRPSAPVDVLDVDSVAEWAWPRRFWVAIGTSAAILAMFVMVAAASPTVRGWLGFGPAGETSAALQGTVALPVLSTSDVALVRARTLYGRGRLAEALQALDRVGLDSASRGAADTLRVEIQRLLLASAQPRAHGGGDQ